MTTASYILGIATSALVLIVVIESLRRRRLRERHAIWWFVAGLLALTVSIFPVTLDWVSGLIGVEVPTNLVFFVSIAILFLVCLQYGSELTDLENKTRRLAEQTALLELRISDAEARAQTGRRTPKTDR
jgi:hypothetical protein